MEENMTDLTPEEQKKLDRSKKIKKELIDYAKAILVAVVLAMFIITFIAQSFYVDGLSMEPNYHHGERILVDKVTYRFSAPKRGDTVVFRYPMDPTRRFIKRVVAIPGDTVEIVGGEVFINGIMIDEPYILSKSFSPFGPEVVPVGSVFVMGDNRNNSHDSRSPSVGMVPYDLIVGKGLFVYWPVGAIRLCKHYRDYPDLDM